MVAPSCNAHDIATKAPVNSVSPSHDPEFQLMDQYLTDVAVELFAAYDVPIEYRSAIAAQDLQAETYCMASIGYTGEGLKGTLVLAATRAAAEAWTSAAGGTEADVIDTVGEFSNMLLGRLKGRLLRQGIPISLATPLTVVGTRLPETMSPGKSSWHFFEGPRGWHLGTRLDAAFEPGFLRLQTHAEPAEAGDTIFF